MEKIIKQVIGVDVSKDTLDANISFLLEDLKMKNVETKCFSNDKKGLKEIIAWIKKKCLSNMPPLVLCEATGVYYELLVYSIYEAGFPIAVILPNKISHFIKSNNIRNINDKVSAQQISEFGLMRNLTTWQPPKENLRIIKGLGRERKQLLKTKTELENRKHAQDSSILTDAKTTLRTKELIASIAKQVKEIDWQIKDIVRKDKELYRKIKNLQTIEGVGFITAIIVVAETDGFNLIRNARQLVCYTGLDVVSKDSGTSVHQKGKISHKGNKYIRSAMYFPSLTNVKYKKSHKEFFDRVYQKHYIKMKAYVAVQRKLLMLMYTLWKNDTTFDPNYESNKNLNNKSIKHLEQPNEAALTELVPDCSM
jgi:transposase